MSIKLKTITENTWLVLGDSEDVRIGLLSEMHNEYTLMLKGVKKRFLSRKEINNYFSENIFDNIMSVEEEDPNKTYYINGFPVDFDNPHEVIIKGNNLPLFSKKSTSDIYYSAGHYCLNFPKNWMPAYCPKLSTLQSYEYAGPFKTDAEMRINLAKLRKEKNSSKK